MRYAVTSDRLISEPETAEVLGISARTVRRLAALGYLERIKVLGSTRYKASEIQAIIRAGTTARRVR